MITAECFKELVSALGEQAEKDIAWSESVSRPSDAESFAIETIFVICNSGMKNTVARGIFERCKKAVLGGKPVAEVFRHAGKASAIETIWHQRHRLWQEYMASADRLGYLEGLPWIGKITKYHLAKNFGENVAKPDVHMVRLAQRERCTVQQMCDRLAAETGLRSATVDTVLWRACAVGLIDSRTGRVSV